MKSDFYLKDALEWAISMGASYSYVPPGPSLMCRGREVKFATMTGASVSMQDCVKAIASNVGAIINLHAREMTARSELGQCGEMERMPYKAQYILEELINTMRDSV